MKFPRPPVLTPVISYLSQQLGSDQATKQHIYSPKRALTLHVTEVPDCYASPPPCADGWVDCCCRCPNLTGCDSLEETQRPHWHGWTQRAAESLPQIRRMHGPRVDLQSVQALAEVSPEGSGQSRASLRTSGKPLRMPGRRSERPLCPIRACRHKYARHQRVCAAYSSAVTIGHYIRAKARLRMLQLSTC